MIFVMTLLLDSQIYPAQEILQAYLRRWKTTLQMDMLRNDGGRVGGIMRIHMQR